MRNKCVPNKNHARSIHDGGFTDPTEDGEPGSPFWYNWMANLERYEVDPEWQFAGQYSIYIYIYGKNLE